MNDIGNLRRLLHESADALCDVLSERSREANKRPEQRRRHRVQKEHKMPEGVSPETVEKARRIAKKAGFI